MRSLQSASRAILFPLPVLVLCASCVACPASAVSAPSGLLSGVTTLRTLSLEGNSATLASSPENEVASIASAALASSDNVAIRAVNPGYTTDAGKNTGELIELINLSDDEVLLGGLQLVYKSKSAANPTVLYEFPAGARFVGRSILLRYSGAPEVSDDAEDLVYDTSIAMAGSLALIKPSTSANSDSIIGATGSETVLSQVCWTGEEGCLPVFSTTVKSRSYTTILRDDETGEYSHVNNPELLFSPESSGLYLPPEAPDSASSTSNDSGSTSSSASKTNASSGFNPSASPVCTGLRFSEILTYYSDNPSEQFIEIYNSSEKSVDISKCSLRYKKKLYNLASPAALNSTPSSLVLPGAYYVYRPETALTKNPTSDLLFEIVDTNGDIVDSLSLPHGQKKKTSYALTGHNPDGSEIWQITYNITPGSANVFQEFQTCPAGKIINVLTGNCVNVSTMKSSLNDCGAGKYRNPETGRCKSYSSKDSEQAPCQEGYERNPETNRCRKIKNNSGTDYPVVPITNTEDQTSFVALWAILAIAGLGLVYVVFQFRREIIYFFHSLITKIRH